MTEAPPRRVLVAYSSRLGSTAEVAQFIGATLAEDGATVDVKAIREVDDLRSYERVVIGSAIRYDRWLGDARRFVARHRAALAGMPVALFFTCLAMSDPTGAGAAKGEEYARKVGALVPGVEASSVGRFAGVLDASRAPLLTRLILRAIRAATGVEEGDHRDWEAIRAWSRALWPAGGR